MNLVVRFCFYALPMGIALLGGCGKDRTSTASGVAHIAKIKVKRDGVIVLNNDTVTLEQLKTSLSKLTQSAGSAVWYYRENPAGEPHPNAMLVLQAIIEAKLPVKLSTKPDFTDFLGPDGASDLPR